MKRVAAIDVGTNTIRLLVADNIDETAFIPVLRKQFITRLGGGFSAEGLIQDAAMTRTIAGLKDFGQTLTRLGTEEVLAVGTSVIRNARNGASLIQKVREEAGIEIQPISGETEARLAARGAILPLRRRFDRALIFDIGGGSTEFVLTQGNSPIWIESTALGVVSLTETYLTEDPPSEMSLGALTEAIRHLILPVRQGWSDNGLFPFQPENTVVLIGIAGTPTTLAALDLGLESYLPERVNNHRLGRTRVGEILCRLREKKAMERLQMPGLERGREDLIIAGATIVTEIMDTFGLPDLTVMDSGILEGLILYSSSSSPASRPCFSSR